MNLFICFFLLLLVSAQSVTVRLELHLDSTPQETSWEVRGPLPRPDLIDGVTYDYYQQENAIVEEAVELSEGLYWFLLKDYADNGIENGSYKITAALTSGPNVLAEGNGNFSGSTIAEFEIPRDQPMIIELENAGGYVRGARV